MRYRSRRRLGRPAGHDITVRRVNRVEGPTLDANGLLRPSEPPLVRYSPGADARFRLPHRRVFPESAPG